MNDISVDVKTMLITAVESMPAFPRSVQKILEITRSVDWTPRDLVAAIEKDPVITMKVLRAVNSAQLGLATKITSVNRSVVYLGQNTIKMLALSIAATGILPSTNAAGFDIRRYLMHSLTTAALARQLCCVYAPGEADPGDCYIAGLLHDFGEIVFAHYMPEQFREVLAASAEDERPAHRVESELLGADHAVVGAMLAQKWQFPTALIDCIRTHHSADAPTTAMNDCLRMADVISHRIGERGGLSLDPYRKGEAVVNPKRFGMDLAMVTASLGDIDDMTADAVGFALSS